MTPGYLSPAELPLRRSAAHLRKIERALADYPRNHETAIKAEAAKHYALADLALSFPALLFVLAVPHKGIDTEALRHGVLAGEPLKALAKRAGLPMWLRQLRPAAFEEKLGPVPCGDLMARQMANFIPRKSKHHARWLWRVSFTCRWGDESFALWVAKMWAFTHGGRSESTFAMLALWSWYCAHPETELGCLVQKRWRMQMDWKQAVNACNSWIESVRLHLDMNTVPCPAKLKAGTVAGFDFVHLATSKMVADEATAMRNCLKSYGYDVTCYGHELWSMRKNGARVATLCISNSNIDHLPAITEIKQAGNQFVSRDLALAARRWFELQDIQSIELKGHDMPDDAIRRLWQRGFKPYWLEKCAMPQWVRIGGPFELRNVSA